MMRSALGLFLAVAVFYGAACAVLFFVQRSLIYFPQPASVHSVASRMTLPTPEGDVLVTVLPRAGRAALVYFGGNAEDVTHSLADLAQAFPGRSLYLMHYRGYG